MVLKPHDRPPALAESRGDNTQEAMKVVEVDFIQQAAMAR
jgi:hypothetical protein